MNLTCRSHKIKLDLITAVVVASTVVIAADAIS